ATASRRGCRTAGTRATPRSSHGPPRYASERIPAVCHVGEPALVALALLAERIRAVRNARILDQVIEFVPGAPGSILVDQFSRLGLVWNLDPLGIAVIKFTAGRVDLQNANGEFVLKDLHFLAAQLFQLGAQVLRRFVQLAAEPLDFLFQLAHAFGT